MKWEYLILSPEDAPATTKDTYKQDYEMWLNSLGDEGWELATFDGFWHFKREVDSDGEL